MRHRGSLCDAVRAALPADASARDAVVRGLPVLRALAASRTTAADVVRLPDGRRAVRKLWVWPRWSDRARGTLRTTILAPCPASREFAALRRLRDLPSGPFAPEPWSWTETRRAGVLVACTLLLDEVPDACDLTAFLRTERDGARRRAVLADLAIRTREMHGAGLVDREHHPRNVLVAGTRTWKVDCWKQRTRGVPLSARDVATDLAALDVGLARLATPDERGTFLAGAAGGAWSPSLAERVAAERARIDPRESRRLG